MVSRAATNYPVVIRHSIALGRSVDIAYVARYSFQLQLDTASTSVHNLTCSSYDVPLLSVSSPFDVAQSLLSFTSAIVTAEVSLAAIECHKPTIVMPSRLYGERERKWE